MCNITDKPQEICSILANNSAALNLIGSKLEPCKTEILHISKDGREEVYTVRDGISDISAESKFEEVFEKKTTTSTLRYLGDQLGPVNSAINIRLSQANKAFGKFYHPVWKRSNLSYKTKIKLFDASMVSILSYGLKCHAANSTTLRKLDNFCLRKLKSIFGFQFDDRISYARIDAELSFFNIPWKWPSLRIKKARISFFIQSLDKPSITQLLTRQPGEKRKRGRPKTRLIDVIVQDLDELQVLKDEDGKPITFLELTTSILEQLLLPYKEKSEKVMSVCTIYKDEILRVVEICRVYL